MTDPRIELPPFGKVAAALRKTTEHLAREVARPSESPPAWSEFEWAVARSVAVLQGTCGLLVNRLRWRGPAAWHRFLEQQCAQTALRDAAIGELLERLDARAREAGIPFVALKGSALRSLGLYRAGERPMADVDLLIRAEHSAAVAALLDALGYVRKSETDGHVNYYPRHRPLASDLGEHVDNPVPVEIHTAVAETLPVDKVDVTAHLLPARPHAGRNPYPTLAALLLHLLLHAAGNMKAHALRQIQLHDIALLAARSTPADSEALLEIASTADGLWWAFPPLALTQRYYGCVPPEWLRELRPRCPRLLRGSSERADLTDVSWSNLKIAAFPGLAWSRTAADALRYARRRAWPSRTELSQLDTALGLQPQLREVAWYQLPHGNRIVRWLVSRPPRVQTILSVTAALRGTLGRHG